MVFSTLRDRRFLLPERDDLGLSGEGIVETSQASATKKMTEPSGLSIYCRVGLLGGRFGHCGSKGEKNSFVHLTVLRNR